MSTNYYMMTTKKELVEKYFPNEYVIDDYPFLGYKIHIGKRSVGWMPLFQMHNNAYQSVSEMKEFITKNKEDVRLYDEYAKQLTLDELNEELINWGEEQEVRYMKYIPEGVKDKTFGWLTYFVEGTKDDYTITIPYDHAEYEKLDPYGNYKEYRELNGEPYYTKDKDGYTFIKHEFC